MTCRGSGNQGASDLVFVPECPKPVPMLHRPAHFWNLLINRVANSENRPKSGNFLKQEYAKFDYISTFGHLRCTFSRVQTPSKMSKRCLELVRTTQNIFSKAYVVIILNNCYFKKFQKINILNLWRVAGVENRVLATWFLSQSVLYRFPCCIDLRTSEIRRYFGSQM